MEVITAKQPIDNIIAELADDVICGNDFFICGVQPET